MNLARITFGMTLGLFFGFLLWPLGPAAPFALSIPLGFYTIWRTTDAHGKGER